MKTKSILSAILFFLPLWGIAQCDFDLTAEIEQHSSCQSNGIITASISGSEIDASRIEFQLDNGSVVTVSSGNNARFLNLGATTYKLTAITYCKSNGSKITKTINLTIETSYVLPSIGSTVTQKSLTCYPSGCAEVQVKNGKGPYTLTFTNYPSNYQGEKEFTIENENDRFLITSLAAGNYAFEVRDACTYNQTQSFSVENFANDFPDQAYYGPYYADSKSCTEFSFSKAYVYGELYNLWSSSDYYEVAFSSDGTKKWQPVEENLTVDLGKTLKELLEVGHVTVYLRLKGTTCEKEISSLNINNNPTFNIWQINVKCDKFDLQYQLLSNYSNLLCPPITVKIFDDNQSLIHTKEYESHSINDSKEIPHGKYTVELTDKNGVKIEYPVDYSAPDQNKFYRDISTITNCKSYKQYFYIGYSEYVCTPISWTILDENNTIVNMGTLESTENFSIDEIPFGKLKIKFNYNESKEEILELERYIPDEQYFYLGEFQPETCNTYKQKIYSSYKDYICAPFTWTLYDEDDTELQSGKQEDTEDFYISGIPYKKVKLIIKYNDKEEILEWEKIKDDHNFKTSRTKSVCENFDLSVTLYEKWCPPYEWILTDDQNNEIRSGSGYTEESFTIPNIEYKPRYSQGTLKVTDSEGNSYSEAVSLYKYEIYLDFVVDKLECDGFNLDLKFYGAICYPYKWYAINARDNSLVIDTVWINDPATEIQTVGKLPYGDYYVYIEHKDGSDNFYLSKYKDLQYPLQATTKRDKCNGVVSFDIRPEAIFCYPYTWAITDYYTGDTIQKGIQYDNQMVEAYFELDKSYYLKIKDNFDCYEDRYLYVYDDDNYVNGYYSSNCTGLAIYFYRSWWEDYYPGIKIEFISGPLTPKHPVIEFTDTVSSQYIYPFSSNYFTEEYVDLPNGEYKFNTYTPCGKKREHSFVRRKAEVESFELNRTEDCSGLTIQPRAKVKIDSDYVDFYYVMLNSETGASEQKWSGYDPSFTINLQGTYLFMIEYDGCYLDTVSITYNKFALNPVKTSGFSCSASSEGQVFIEAIGGITPYVYELYLDGRLLDTNNSGKFDYGEAGKTYQVKISDNCGSSFEQPVAVIDLSKTNFITASPQVCYGGEIKLQSINLGVSDYGWTGPNGFISDEQNPVIRNVTTANAGEYYIKVMPIGCNEFIEQSVDVGVYDKIEVPIAKENYYYCKDDPASEMSAKELNNHTLQWYDATQSPIDVPTPNTNLVGKHIYYVAQSNNATLCSSEYKEITVTVGTPPIDIVEVSAPKICFNTSPELNLTGAKKDYTYLIFSDLQGNNEIAKRKSLMDGDLKIALSNTISENTTYYIQTISMDGCPSKEMHEIEVPVTILEMSPEILPMYIHEYPYNVQLTSNAENPNYTYSGDLPQGISISNTGLIAGTVPVSEGFTEKIVSITVSDVNGCSFSKDYVFRSCEGKPDMPSDYIEYCKGDPAIALQATSPKDLDLIWFDENKIQLAIAPTPKTDIAGKQIYYVSQYNDQLKCTGDTAKIEVMVHDLPIAELPVVPYPTCKGSSPRISVSNTQLDYLYEIYHADKVFAQIIGTGGSDAVEFTLHDTILLENAELYLRVKDNFGCKSETPDKLNLPVIILEMSPDILPMYIHEHLYNVQLKSNAENANYTYSGDLPQGISISNTGLILGTVPILEGFTEKTVSVTVSDVNHCSLSKDYVFRSCEGKPDIPSDYVEYCKGDPATALQATSAKDLDLIWFDENKIQLTTAPTPKTDIAGKQIYYVSQYNDQLKCTGDTAKIEVMVHDLPLVDLTAIPSRICKGTSPIISISNTHLDYFYEVYFGNRVLTSIVGTGGSNIIDIVLSDTLVLENASFYIRAKDQNGCKSISPLIIDIPVTVLTILPETLPLFYKDIPYNTQLNTNAVGGEFSYNGNLPSGLEINNQGLIHGTVEDDDLSNKPIEITVIDSDGCSLTKEYLLRTCDPAPKIRDIYEYCYNDPSGALDLQANEGLELKWYDDQYNVLSQTPFPNTKKLGITNYYVAHVNPQLACESNMVEVPVKVNPLPSIIGIPQSSVACMGGSSDIHLSIGEGLTYFLYGDSNGTKLIYSFHGNTGDTTINTGVDIYRDTIFYLGVKDANTCESEKLTPVTASVKQLYIKPDKLPIYKKDADYSCILSTNAENPSFSLEEGELPMSLSFYNTGEIRGKVLENNNKKIELKVRVSDKDGCVVEKIFDLYGEIFIPQVITPNEDGFNDHFMQGFRVIIFDRVGNRIFQGNDGWDGSQNGELVSSDTYFYIVHYTDENGTEKTAKGYVGLIREE